jgi:tripartite-type tricarboxylate transporter receptor subunit TctC
MMAQLDILHVPYRGSSGIYPDLMTGKVHVLFDNLPGSVEFVKTGKLRALGVTTAKRSEVLPDVPTVGETVAGYEASVFYGVAGPKGIPVEVMEVLNKAFNAALADPKIQQRIRELGGEPMPMAPAEFGKLVMDETEKWGKVVRAANLSIE